METLYIVLEISYPVVTVVSHLPKCPLSWHVVMRPTICHYCFLLSFCVFQNDHWDASHSPEEIITLSWWSRPTTQSLSSPAHSCHEVSTCHKHPVAWTHFGLMVSSWQSLSCFSWSKGHPPGLRGGTKQRRTAFPSVLALSLYANGNLGSSSVQGSFSTHVEAVPGNKKTPAFCMSTCPLWGSKPRDEKLFKSFVRMAMLSNKLGHMLI